MVGFGALAIHDIVNCKCVCVCFFPLQAVDSDLVPYLLKLLGDGLTGLENPAATKAQIVKSLKAMQTCLQHGEKVSTQPNSYSISHYAALLLHVTGE